MPETPIPVFNFFSQIYKRVLPRFCFSKHDVKNLFVAISEFTILQCFT